MLDGFFVDETTVMKKFLLYTGLGFVGPVLWVVSGQIGFRVHMGIASLHSLSVGDHENSYRTSHRSFAHAGFFGG